jgi:hypothetical protein
MKPQYIYAKETLVLRISKTSIERQNRKEKTMLHSKFDQYYFNIRNAVHF